MNIEKCEELAEVIDVGMRSLNEDCLATNLGVKKKPFDHVFYYTSATKEISTQSKVEVIDIIKEMEDFWDSTDPYPGDPYDGNLFSQYYSDHKPIAFEIVIPNSDDD